MRKFQPSSIIVSFLQKRGPEGQWWQLVKNNIYHNKNNRLTHIIIISGTLLIANQIVNTMEVVGEQWSRGRMRPAAAWDITLLLLLLSRVYTLCTVLVTPIG